MSEITDSIDVNVPVRQAYDQWTQFEEFPRFMDNVKEVRQLDDTHLHWVASVAGQTEEWDAVVTEQTPDQRVAWQATQGAENAGSVDFHRLSDDATRVTLTMNMEPEGVVEKAGAAVGIPQRSVKGDLEHFKSFIESRGRATGAWRGKVDQPDVS